MRISGRVHQTSTGVTIDLPTIRIVDECVDLFLHLLKQTMLEFEIIIECAEFRRLHSLEFGVEFRQVPDLEVWPALEHVCVGANEHDGAA